MDGLQRGVSARDVRGRQRTELVPAIGEDPLWDPAKVSEYLGVAPGTLTQWRHRGVGPESFRLGGGLVRYRRSVVIAWVAAEEKAERESRLAAAG